jgi:hypothetical protein
MVQKLGKKFQNKIYTFYSVMRLEGSITRIFPFCLNEATSDVNAIYRKELNVKTLTLIRFDIETKLINLLGGEKKIKQKRKQSKYLYSIPKEYALKTSSWLQGKKRKAF